MTVYTNKAKLAELSKMKDDSDESTETESEKSIILEKLFENPKLLTEPLINGEIYAIKSKNTKDVYIGSTTQKLKYRLSAHKKDFKNYNNSKCNYVTSFKIVHDNDCYIESLKTCKNVTKQELHRIEGEFIKLTKNCINKCIAGRTTQEYNKQHYQNNKKKINDYQNQKNICNMCNRNYTTGNKARHEKSKFHQQSIINITTLTINISHVDHVDILK